MLKDVRFVLDGPICQCHKQNIAWNIQVNKAGTGYRLVFFCDDCKTTIAIPGDEILAAVDCDRPYPGGEGRNKPPPPKKDPPPPPKPPLSSEGLKATAEVLVKRNLN